MATKTKKVTPVYLIRVDGGYVAVERGKLAKGRRVNVSERQKLATRFPERASAAALSLITGGHVVRLIRKARILRFKPVEQGFAHAWWKCRTCGKVLRYVYQPYSLATPILTTCHGIGERDYGCDTITEKEARAYFLTKYDKVIIEKRKNA